MKTAIRGFYNTSEAWYSKILGFPFCDIEVMFGMYIPNDGTQGEMAMHWHELGGKSVPRLECFNDAWRVLGNFSDVIAALAQFDDQDITPRQFCELLLSLGFTDLTQYDRAERA